VNDEPLASFCDWFSQAMAGQVQSTAPLPTAEYADGLRYQRSVARALWSVVPVPSHRWRARLLPKFERNDPCHCGSGRKFKQCCAQFGLVEMPMDSEQVYAMALAEASPEMLTPDKLRQVPALALGMAATTWNERGQFAQTIEILQPLFLQRHDLDERYELAFDCLVDALLNTGAEPARSALVIRVGKFPDKILATAARCRQVSMLADQGDYPAAWALFGATQRFNPTDMQLWPLELTMLLAEGRDEAAKLRAPILAAQARRAGHPDLAQTLIDMAQKGMTGIYEDMDNDALDEEDVQWMALCAQTPKTVDVQACRALYRINTLVNDQEGMPFTLEIRPGKELTAMYRRWNRQFEVGKPLMTYLQGDVDHILSNITAVQDFLNTHPQAWYCMEVLDDLLLAGADLTDFETPGVILTETRRLAAHALAVLKALLGEAPVQLNWADTPTRPLLRILAQAIELSRYQSDDVATLELMTWSLALNPHDNHGWRALLVPLHLDQARPDYAWRLLDQYPNDMPPSEHLRALALFMQGKVDQAAQVVAQAHSKYPRFVKSLLHDALDSPPQNNEPGISMAGDEAAWEHRQATRPVWVRTGALAWLRDLNLPDPKPIEPPQPTKPLKPAKTAKTVKATPVKLTKTAETFTPNQQKHLRKHYAQYVQLHGLLMAIGWAPDLIMPNQWLPLAMNMRSVAPQDLPPKRALEVMNQDMQALSGLVNHFNRQVLTSGATSQQPLVDLAALLAETGDAAAFLWAAGFVQGSELVAGAWRRAGRPVTPKNGAFGALYALAAQAQRDATASADQTEPWRARSETDQPLLVGMQADALGPTETLLLSMEDLWRITVPLRQARVGGGLR
jgi:uncharacterized protein YecA (UPF0149 family)